MRIFQRVRMNLIVSKKIKDYIQYALGEIVLVTIGILLALSINTWNENRKKVTLVKELINELNEELQFNIDRISYLDTATVQSGYSFRMADSLLALRVEALQDGIDSSEKALIFGSVLWRLNAFNLSSDVYHTMVETKVINMLDDSVKLAIRKYYKLIEREEIYNMTYLSLIKEAVSNCRYGYGELGRAYALDSNINLNNYNWVFDNSSKEFIDLRNCFETTYGAMHDSRSRMINIIEESQKLKVIISPLTAPKPH